MAEIDWYGYSDPGGREINEDSLLYKFDEGRGFCAALADGLGGHGGGKYASGAAAVSIMQSFMSADLEKPEEFNVWFQSANQAVLSLQSKECEMKTTLVVLLIRDGTAMWGHIGDSRLYYFKNGRLAFQTEDHSVSQMAVFRGEITAGQIRGHEDRNRLLRAIGMEETIRIDTSETVLSPGDEHSFLLCSDGFWEYVTEREMERELLFSTTPKEWINRMRERLLKKTRNKKNDNYTAAAVFYDE